MLENIHKWPTDDQIQIPGLLRQLPTVTKVSHSSAETFPYMVCLGGCSCMLAVTKRLPNLCKFKMPDTSFLTHK